MGGQWHSHCPTLYADLQFNRQVAKDAKKTPSKTIWYPKIPLPKIVPAPAKWRKRFGTGSMVIARPLDADALIRAVERGFVVTQAQLSQRLAPRYRVEHACPLTTGISVRKPDW